MSVSIDFGTVEASEALIWSVETVAVEAWPVLLQCTYWQSVMEGWDLSSWSVSKSQFSKSFDV